MCDVGNRVVANQKLPVREALFEHPIQTLGFGLIALDGVGNLFWCVAEKHVGLPLHGPDTAHLEHQPLHHLRTGQRLAGQKATVLFGEVQQNGARFEHRKAAAAIAGVGIDLAVNDGRDAPVGVELQVVRQFLIALRQADRMHGKGHSQLLEHDRGLPAIGGCRGIQINHVDS